MFNKVNMIDLKYLTKKENIFKEMERFQNDSHPKTHEDSTQVNFITEINFISMVALRLGVKIF